MNFDTSILSDFLKILLLMEQIDFWTEYAQRIVTAIMAMMRYKTATVLTLSAERFNLSSSPNYKKYLPLPNHLHFGLDTFKSIVKVKNKV